MIKNKEWPHLKNLDVNNIHGQAMSQKFPINCFRWVEDLSQFDEGFIKSYNKKSTEIYFLEVHIQYAENYHFTRKNKDWKS